MTDPPRRLTSVVHNAINPLVMMAAQNRGKQVPTALINTADKRRKRVAINGLAGIDDQLYADLDDLDTESRYSASLSGAACPLTRRAHVRLIAIARSLPPTAACASLRDRYGSSMLQTRAREWSGQAS